MLTSCRIIAAAVACISGGWAQSYSISTVAGTDRLLDGSQGTSVPLRQPRSVAVKSDGSVYIADTVDNRVRVVGASGVISTVAGTGEPSYSGDRGKATAATLSSPSDLALDANGNIYIADRDNYRVRRISADGTINTVAGVGTKGSSGDGGPALQAQLVPLAITIDRQGNLYIADVLAQIGGSRIRKVDSTGTITTIAGTGNNGFSGAGVAKNASLGLITGMTTDASGNLYMADLVSGRVLKVDQLGNLSIVAGTDYGFVVPDGHSALETIMNPVGVVIDPSGRNLYISDVYRNNILRVDVTTGMVFTFAGAGRAGAADDNVPLLQTHFNFPHGLAFDSSGNMYVADRDNARVRKIAAGTITSIAGTSIRDGGPAAGAFLNGPNGLAADPSGRILVADTNNGAARLFTPGGAINRVGQLNGGFPMAVAADTGGSFYVTDDEPRLLKIAPDGTTTSIAGTGRDGYGGDGGPAAAAPISSPTGVAVDSSGAIYITDNDHNRIRKIVNGTINTIAGNGDYHYNGENVAATAAAFDPFDIAADNKGNIFIADQANQRVRRIGADGKVITIAGTGTPGNSGDGGPATEARLFLPSGVAVDNAGNLYIADFGNSAIRRVTPAGLISTIAGNGTPFPMKGDGGPATAAQMNPLRLAVDASGNVFFTDLLNDRVRKLTPRAVAAASIKILGGNNQSATAGTAVPNAIAVQVSDGSGTPAPGIAVTFSVSPAGSATVKPSPALTLADGSASAKVTLGNAAGTVTITASASGVAGTVSFTLTAKPVVAATDPHIAAGGVVSAGLSTPPVKGLAPNAIASVFGTNFAPDGTARQTGPNDLVDGKIPTVLAGVCVQIGPQRAPIFAVYPTQVNFQVPSLPVLNATVQVVTNCETATEVKSLPEPVTIQAAAPEFFYFNHAADGRNAVAAINAVTGAYIGPAGLISGLTTTPAKAGDVLTIFGTGFGATNPSFAPGELPNTAAQIAAPVTVSIGGVTLDPADVLYAGVSQNAGLYQLNLRVPASVPAGDQAIVITAGGVASPAKAYITIAGN